MNSLCAADSYWCFEKPSLFIFWVGNQEDLMSHWMWITRMKTEDEMGSENLAWANRHVAGGEFWDGAKSEREGEIDFRSGRRMRFSFLNMCKLEMPFDIGGDGRRQAYIWHSSSRGKNRKRDMNFRPKGIHEDGVWGCQTMKLVRAWLYLGKREGLRSQHRGAEMLD